MTKELAFPFDVIRRTILTGILPVEVDEDVFVDQTPSMLTGYMIIKTRS